MLLGGGDALEGADVRKLGVIYNDADSLCSVHDGAAADGDDAVSTGVLESLNAVLDVFDGGVCLYIGEESVINTGGLHRVEDLVDLAALDNVLAGADKSLLEAAGGQLRADLLDSAGAMVGNSVEDYTIDHCETFLSIYHNIVLTSLNGLIRTDEHTAWKACLSFNHIYDSTFFLGNSRAKCIFGDLVNRYP